MIAVADTLVRALGQTNFVHFWEDNPELDTEARLRQSAENCLALTCLAAVHGSFESIDELYEAQTKLLPINEQVSVVTLREIVDRLRRRGVLVPNSDGASSRIEPLIFRDWLNEYAEILLLRNWREFKRLPIGAPDPKSYAKKFTGKYEHRTISGGIGHNLPQEAPQAFAEAIIDVDRM